MQKFPGPLLLSLSFFSACADEADPNERALYFKVQEGSDAYHCGIVSGRNITELAVSATYRDGAPGRELTRHTCKDDEPLTLSEPWDTVETLTVTAYATNALPGFADSVPVTIQPMAEVTRTLVDENGVAIPLSYEPFVLELQRVTFDFKVGCKDFELRFVDRKTSINRTMTSACNQDRSDFFIGRGDYDVSVRYDNEKALLPVRLHPQEDGDIYLDDRVRN